MGLSDDGYDEVDQRFENLCFDLNMDTHAKDEAWASYQRIRKNFTLEGDQINWLVCALYEACRRCIVPTIDRGTVEGNGVSLTRLLRSAQFNLIQFFDKMRKWSDMANLPQEFRNKIDQLERNFAVSTVIFKKFGPIFVDVFKNPADEIVRMSRRSHKQKKLPCAVSDVFNFCWTMFVQVKGNFPAISDDLVNSYHLLLCCIDWVHSNVVLGGRTDLLNPAFTGASEGDQDCPCIVTTLCEKHEGLELEAMGIKEHWWKLYIKKLFDKKILRGKTETLSGVLDLMTFEANNKTINNAYDEYVLTVGDFDERIFLGELADEEIGTPAKSSSFVTTSGELRERLQEKTNLQKHFDQTKTLAPSTPLTGRLYLSEKEASITPVSTATQSVGRLQALLCGRPTCPGDSLIEIFLSCSRNPEECVTGRIRSMGERFCTAYAQPSGDDPGFHVDFAKKRLQLAESLYYKVLENILHNEMRLCKVKDTKPDLSALLEQDVFHASLFALCLEVVIFSYNSQRTFPWIVDTFDIGPYHFYKVIEILIRAEDGLSRDVVKHLNHIEERILEATAWKSDSALWDALKDHSSAVLTCEEVMLPNEQVMLPPDTGVTPVHPIVRRVLTTESLRPILPKDTIISPSRYSASDRFLSPKPESTKRRLFTSNVDPIKVPLPSPASSFVAPGSTISLLKPSTAGASPRREASSKFMAFQQAKTEDGTPILIPVNTRSVSTKNAGNPGVNVVLAPNVVALSPRHLTSTAPACSVRRVMSPLTKVLSAQRGGDRKGVTIVSRRAELSVGMQLIQQSPATARSKKISSLGLFFRKVYHLASVRLRDLCERLGMCDETQQKIWTCFEFCLVHHADLMMDRHLDQLLMCAVYVMTKILNQSVSFQEIMKNYRLQPQAQSHIYRSVLLTDKRRHTSGSSDGSRANSRSTSPLVDTDSSKDTRRRRIEMSIRSTSTLPVPQPNSHPPTPTKFYGSGSTFDFGEERGDVILFYNQVYVRRMQTFVKKFAMKAGQDHPLLSPFPHPRNHPSSPRRVNNKCQVYISPYKTGSAPTTPTKGRLYCFDRSPAKDLHEINDMIRMGDRSSLKHALPVTDDGASPAKKVAYQSPLEKKLQRLTAERREVNGGV